MYLQLVKTQFFYRFSLEYKAPAINPKKKINRHLCRFKNETTEVDKVKLPAKKHSMGVCQRKKFVAIAVSRTCNFLQILSIQEKKCN